ncbi:MAG: PorT family protein [Bacteroidia bacterium]|nr:PorT family protein [Bacteroidia bacterium]
MKKIYVLAVLLLVCVTSGFSQAGPRFGIKISPTINMVKYDSSGKEVKGAETKAGIGFTPGLMFDYGFSDNVAIGTGLNLSLRSFTIKTGSGTFSNEVKYSLTYVELPINLKLKTNSLGGSGIHAKFQTGPTIDFKVGANANSENDIIILDKGKNKIGKHINLLNVNWAFGGGVEWDIENVGTIDIGVAYHLALTNILNQNYEFKVGNTGTKIYEGYNLKASYIGLNLGFYFPSSK